MSTVLNHLKREILAFLATSGKSLTRHDLARQFNVSVATIAPMLEALAAAGRIQRTEVVTERGQRAYAYRVEAVRRWVDRQHRTFYTAPCPTCGHRRRLVRRADGYYLIHCGAGIRLQAVRQFR